MHVDGVLEAHPGEEQHAEGEVEEPFVGDGEDDESGREGEEDDDKAMDVVRVWLEAVQEGDHEGGDCRLLEKSKEGLGVTDSALSSRRSGFRGGDRCVLGWR